jgi:hypothetical protein
VADIAVVVVLILCFVCNERVVDPKQVPSTDYSSTDTTEIVQEVRYRPTEQAWLRALTSQTNNEREIGRCCKAFCSRLQSLLILIQYCLVPSIRLFTAARSGAINKAAICDITLFNNDSFAPELVTMTSDIFETMNAKIMTRKRTLIFFGFVLITFVPVPV